MTTPVGLSNPKSRYLGLGYKAGNALGNAGGDLSISLINHLDFDLQASWLYNKLGGSGFGISPGVRGLLLGHARSTPYLSVGYVYFRVRFDNGATGSGDAVFANVGYEFKLPAEFVLTLGGGVTYAGNVSTSDGKTVVIGEDGLRPNLEVGVRYVLR
jgi:hypothetical protein